MTDKEIKEYIKRNYYTQTNKQLAQNLKISEFALGEICKELGLSKQKHKPWTEKEDAYLKEHYVDMTSKELGEKFGRSIQSVNARRKYYNLTRHPSWTEDETHFLLQHYLDMSYEEIAKHLGKTFGAVNAKSFEMNLLKSVPWTEEEEKYVKDNYMILQTREMAETLHRTMTAVGIKAKKLGLKKFPYSCDYHFFEKIDTEEKAYWLGFISADGWISKNNETGSGCVGIELQYGDIEHLKKFNKSISGNYRITDKWKTCSLSLKNPEKKNHMCSIRVYSTVMYNSLVSLGLTSNKSFDLFFPNIPNELRKHYLRGYFDGNGCFSVSNNHLNVSFCTASEKMKNDLICVCKEEGFSFCDYSSIDEFGVKVYRPELNGLKEKIRFLNYLYDESNVYLERKQKKYIKAKMIYEP